MKMDKDVILLEVSSKKSLAVAIVPDSRIESERSASIADIVSGAVVKVTGDGKGSELLARKIILLAQGESVSYLKKAKTGTAFGDTMQSVNCKAQVVSQEPLVVKNRGQQTIQVALAKKHTLLKRVGVDKTALHVGDRVQIRYYDGPEPLLAKEILVYLPDEETK